MAQASLQGLPELLREVTVLGIYRHPNIVPLLCFSLSRRDDGGQEACLVRSPRERKREEREKRERRERERERERQRQRERERERDRERKFVRGICKDRGRVQPV
jgi:hypothetical protein